ncbi:MAG: hypothetical protein ABIG66_02190 [Candidatus Kerfeldbacteria bacterium]
MGRRGRGMGIPDAANVFSARDMRIDVPEGKKMCSKCGYVMSRKSKRGSAGSCPMCQGTGRRADGKDPFPQANPESES